MTTKPTYRNQPSFFNHTAQFGTISSKQNKYTGVSIPQFVPEFKLHYAIYKRSVTQRYLSSLSSEKTDDLLIYIRHNDKVLDTMQVKINKSTYNITDISPSNNEAVDYDLVTLQKITKGA